MLTFLAGKAEKLTQNSFMITLEQIRAQITRKTLECLSPAKRGWVERFSSLSRFQSPTSESRDIQIIERKTPLGQLERSKRSCMEFKITKDKNSQRHKMLLFFR